MTLVAIVTLDGFNELDSFVAMTMLGGVQQPHWQVRIASPTARVTSMNGVTIESQMPLTDLPEADAVLVGSGIRTREYAADPAFLDQLALDPSRQFVGSQCSGALLLAKKGLLDGVPVCTDLTTKPWVIDAVADVVDQPFFASGNVATAGGCLSSHYLAGWALARLVSVEAARASLFYVAPVGEKDAYVDRALRHITAHLPVTDDAAALAPLGAPALVS